MHFRRGRIKAQRTPLLPVEQSLLQLCFRWLDTEKLTITFRRVAYDVHTAQERFRRVPVLQKPVDRASLQRALTANMSLKAQTAAARHTEPAEQTGGTPR